MLDQYSPRVLASTRTNTLKKEIHTYNKERELGSCTYMCRTHVTSRWLSLNDWRRKNTLKLEWVQMKIWLLEIKWPQSKWSGGRTVDPLLPPFVIGCPSKYRDAKNILPIAKRIHIALTPDTATEISCNQSFKAFQLNFYCSRHPRGRWVDCIYNLQSLLMTTDESSLEFIS